MVEFLNILLTNEKRSSRLPLPAGSKHEIWPNHEYLTPGNYPLYSITNLCKAIKTGPGRGLYDTKICGGSTIIIMLPIETVLILVQSQLLRSVVVQWFAEQLSYSLALTIKCVVVLWSDHTTNSFS